MNEEFNPYAAPQSETLTAPSTDDSSLPLAGRWRRVGASFIDSLIIMPVVLPLQFYFGTIQREMERQAAGGSMFNFNPENILWSAFGFIFIVAINWVFLLKGQTIGKKAVKIRIDSISGGACERSKIILKRMLPMQIIYLIPGINFIFMIVDCLMIFRLDKRTLHDLIAGTKVVDLRSQITA